MRFRQRNGFYSFIMSKVVNELISKSEKGNMLSFELLMLSFKLFKMFSRQPCDGG